MGLPSKEQPLTRWLARELDSRGSLARLAIADWHVCLDALREARRSAGRLPAEWDDSLARLIIAALRFSRPDGSPAANFEASKVYTSAGKDASRLVDRYGRNGNGEVPAARGSRPGSET